SEFVALAGSAPVTGAVEASSGFAPVLAPPPLFSPSGVTPYLLALQPMAHTLKSNPSADMVTNWVCFICFLWFGMGLIWPNWVVSYFPKFGKHLWIVSWARPSE